MKVYELGAQDGIDSLRLATRTEPAPGPGEAVVKFHANSLNYRDYIRSALFRHRPGGRLGRHARGARRLPGRGARADPGLLEL
jgi:NADPH:quinone reductase-like Zn-dependent oxidoreductase